MAKQTLIECATCGKSWRKRKPEDATLCPYCGSNAVRDARMSDAPTDASRGCAGAFGGTLVLLVLIGLGAAGYYWWFHLRPPNPAPSVAPPPSTAPSAPEPAPEPPPEPEAEPEPEPAAEVSPPPAPEAPAEPATSPSREWYQLAVNYHNAGRDDLARNELRKVIDAGEPEWVEKAQTLLAELNVE